MHRYAAEQLQTWADRSDAVMANVKEGMKPGALCYTAVDEAGARLQLASS